MLLKWEGSLALPFPVVEKLLHLLDLGLPLVQARKMIQQCEPCRMTILGMLEGLD